MIKAQGLTKKFDQFVALDHINCTIPDGCIYGMVGSNGAGKSTFLRLLTGIYKPDDGIVLMEEAPIYENPEQKKKIAFIADDLYILPGANMLRMSEFYRSSYDTFDKKRFLELAGMFHLDVKKPLSGFSKGMRRQAAIIYALSCKTQYLVFDETFDGLDPIMRNLVKSLVCEDVLERKATAIMTSHSLRELEDICDQLALLHRGGMVLQSEIGNLKTSLFKVQIAFTRDYNRDLFEFHGIDILHFQKQGSVSNLIVRGDKEQVMGQLQVMKPILLELLPLTLEEMFTYELEALGYSFNLEDLNLEGGSK
ncbi:MAG: ATP-binding cassette domain-containing protein [Lachnospiraceae bacterium]